MPGIYSVQFPQVLQDGRTLTVPNAGANPGLNSRPEQASGLTRQFAIAPGESSFEIDAGYVQRDYTADIAVIKQADKVCAAPEDILTYTITVTNRGPDTAVDTRLIDYIHPETLINCEYSVDGGLSWSPWESTYLLGNMSEGESAAILIRGKVPCAPISGITNTAIVESKTNDPYPDNNFSAVITPLCRPVCQWRCCPCNYYCCFRSGCRPCKPCGSQNKYTPGFCR